MRLNFVSGMCMTSTGFKGSKLLEDGEDESGFEAAAAVAWTVEAVGLSDFSLLLGGLLDDKEACDF